MSSELNAKAASLDKEIVSWKQLRGQLSEVRDLAEMAESEADEGMLTQIEGDAAKLESKLDKLELEMMLSGSNDESNAFLNIHPGAGGTESQDWAEMLLRMYLRWAERSGYEVETVNLEPGEVAGIKDAILYLKGRHAFGYLKAENGVHRLVRLSPFNANNKRQTSFCAIRVSPEVNDDIDIVIDDKDIRIDTYRSSGAGGQHVNKTDSAVRITHFPSGIVVTCQNERSQHQNKDMAFRVLRSRIYEMELEKRMNAKGEKAAAREAIEWGSQIRSYVFQPYTMVKDHRTNTEKGNIQAVMDGDIDDFITAYLKTAGRQA